MTELTADLGLRSKLGRHAGLTAEMLAVEEVFFFSEEKMKQA